MSIKLKDTIYDLINKASKDGSGNTITSTYLKLSGGTMTGNLIITDNKYISSSTASAILAVGDSSVFTGASSSLSTIVGSISLPNILRSSSDNLYHYRQDKTASYIILDSFNYTNYVSAKDHTHKYAGSDSVGGAANTVKCTSSSADNTRPIIVTNESNALYYTSKAKLNYSTGRITVGAVTITDTNAIEHIKFSRENYNYITLPTSGSLAVITEGQGIGATTSELTITKGYVYPGTTNVTDLGKTSNKWKNVYATTFTGALSGNADSSTYTTYIRVTETEPTSGTYYYPIWTTGMTSGSNYTPRANDGFRYYSLEGTTSAKGVGLLFLGNSTASGTAGNKEGRLGIYGPSSYYAYLYGPDTATGSFYFPNTGGTLVTHATRGTAVGAPQTPVYIAASGRATACTIAAGSGNTNRSLMVTNGSNGMYYTPTITGNYVTGDLISTVSDTTYVKHTCANSNGAVSIYAATNRGLYDTTNSAWIIYLTQAADHVYVSKWASKGSSTAPVYFNSSGEPVAGSTYAGGTKVTLNGTAKGASTASFYAPTGAGTSGQYLVSTGGVPGWITMNPYDANISRTANTVLAAPNGSAGVASFRKLVAADLPSHSHSSFTVMGVAYNGSAAKTVTATTMVGTLSEGSSNVTDGTMFLSSYASDNGFADTNATNVLYKRKFSCVYNYIKSKLDSVYAAKSHSHSYLPLSGGNVSGHIYLTGSNASSSTSNTSQLVFGTSSTNHVCISSNNNVLVINPTTSTTTNQISLYLDSKSQFPSGINVGSLSIGGEAITFTT